MYSLVTLAQVIAEDSVVRSPNCYLIHGLRVVLGAAHIGFDVYLGHMICLVGGPDLRNNVT